MGHCLVLYHANCYDGFGAAWAAWKALGGEGVVYQPVNYGDAAPPLINSDQGDLILLDFTFPRETLHLLEKEFRLTVLDHHKTAKDDLSSLPYATFDMNKSGAVLAWEHFHPGKTVPPMLEYIQDRDLWRFALPGSREISQYIRSWPFDFDALDVIERDLRFHFSRCRDEGEGMLRFQIQQVRTMAEAATWRVLGGHRVPTVNASVFFSEVGEELCQRNPEAPFAAYYFDRADGKRQWGMRSRNGFDCSAVAKHYGGGGHPGAAGFTTELTWIGEEPLG